MAPKSRLSQFDFFQTFTSVYSSLAQISPDPLIKACAAAEMRTKINMARLDASEVSFSFFFCLLHS